MKKRLKIHCAGCMQPAVFYPAIMPLEAAVTPAMKRARCGVLSAVPRAWEAPEQRKTQRAKIWVR